MRFEIESATTGGLRIIDRIPDHPLSRLEGYNGIGKTVAMHLLELATGTQPYAHLAAAWTSLKQQLTRATIRVEGLRGGHSIQVELTPRTWPDSPMAPDDRFGTARLDDVEIPFSSVGRYLKVTRIGGDETLIVQIRHRIQAHAAAFARHDDHLQQFLDPVEALTDRLHELTVGLSTGELESIEERVHSAASHRSAVEQDLANLTTRGRLIDQIVALEAALAEIGERGPALRAQLEEVERALQRGEQRRRELESRRDELRPLAQRVEELNSTIARLKNRRAIQRGRLARERSRLSALLATVSLPGPAAVPEALEESISERTRLQRDRDAIALLPEVIHLVDSVEASLRQPADSALDEEIIAVVDAGRLSARELRTGVSARRDELRALDEYAVVEQIDARLQQLDERIAQLEKAAAIVPSLERNEQSALATEGDLEAAYREAEANTDASYREVMTQLRELSDELVSLIESRATLRQSRAMLDRYGTEDSLREQIAEVRARLVTDASTAQLLADHRVALERARRELMEAEEEQRAATSAAEEFHIRAEHAWQMLRSDDFGWLNGISELALPTSFSLGNVVPTLARLTDLVDRFRRLVDMLPKRTGRLQEALAGLDRQVGRGPIEGDPDRQALFAFYEAELAQLLMSPQIAETVLEGGTFQEIDLASAELAWTAPDGSPVRRPIEAFSSGEAAFTYILASILQRSEVDTQNRLLVLDEFGAFIQGDRVRVLLEFLRREVLEKGRADQVLVVLPLRQLDDGVERAEVSALREQVDERGYGVTAIET